MFEVSTHWNGAMRIHRATTFAEALQWAACYPTPVFIHTLSGEFVARRG